VRHSTEWLSKSIYILAASLYLAAVVLRTWLMYRGEPAFDATLALLLFWSLLFASEPAVTRRWPTYFSFYLIFQTGLVFFLMNQPGTPDFMGVLLSVLSMQAMLRLPAWVGGLWIALCAVAMYLVLVGEFANQAIALVIIYTASNVFVGSYTRTTRRAQAAHLHNQQLAGELEQANLRLQEFSARAEQLAAARERNRLARELHDSVTQTVFSMNLTTQSAALLLERNPSQANQQLERLYALAHSALSEMQTLINHLKPESSAQEGLPAALRRLLTESQFIGSLPVTLDVEGEGLLRSSEEQNLLRIAQEALNNILKHAQASQAYIRLHLVEPFWMEIEDQGCGFDPTQAQHSGRVGLASMRERAAEIGWTFKIISSPDMGTCIRVAKENEIEQSSQQEGEYGVF
jgi:signal transduction histidine kinase